MGHSQPLFAEPLENRRLLATIVWDGGPSGTGADFNLAANWIGDVRPGAADDAVIGPGTTIVTITGATQVNSIQSARQIQINTNAVIQTSGANALTAPVLLQRGDIRGGTWNFSGDGAKFRVTSQGIMRDLSSNGEFEIDANRSANFYGAIAIPTVRLHEGSVIAVNAGSAFLGTMLGDSRGTNPALVNFIDRIVPSTCTIAIADSASAGLGIDANTNSGVIRSEVAQRTISIGLNVFTNYGAIYVSNGGILLHDAFNLATSLFENDAQIQIRNGGMVRTLSTISNSGFIDVEDSTFAFGGALQTSALVVPGLQLIRSHLQLEGSLDNTGAHLNLDDMGFDLILNGATISGGTISTSDSHPLRALMAFTGTPVLRDVHVAGRIVLDGTENALSLQGATTIDGGVQVLHDATLQLSPNFQLGFQILATSSTLTLTDSLVILPSGVLHFENQPAARRTITGTIVNYGRIEVATANSNLVIAGARLDNFGSIIAFDNTDLELDSVSIANVGQLSGYSGSQIMITSNWSSSGTVSLQNTDFQLRSGTASLRTIKLGFDHLSRIGGRLVLGGHLDNLGQELNLSSVLGSVIFENLEIHGGVVRQAADGMIGISGRVVLADVTVFGTFDISSADRLLLQGATRFPTIHMLSASAIEASPDFVLRDTIQIVGTDANGREITISQIASTGSIVTTSTHRGAVVFYEAVLSNAGSIAVRGAIIHATLTNSGTVRLFGTTAASIDGLFVNAGQFDIDGSSVTFLRSPTNTGIIFIHNQASVTINADGWQNNGFYIISSATLTVNGTTSQNAMRNSGTLQIGAFGLVRLTHGVFTNASSGILSLEI